MRKRGVVAIIAVVMICIIVGLLVFRADLIPSTTNTQNKTLGANVTLVGGKNIPQDIKAVETPTVVSSFKHMIAAGPMVEITPGGKIKNGGSVILRFALHGLQANQMVVIATSESAKGPWTLVEPSVSKDRQYAIVTTSHLSFWQPLLSSLIDVLKSFKKAFVDGVTGDLTTVAEQPTCENQHQARQDNYTIASSAKSTLYWCFGVENNNRVLKIVNRKDYPLEVAHPGLKVEHISQVDLSLQNLARLTSGSSTILYPYEEVDYSLQALAPGQKSVVSTSYSGVAQSLYQLQVGISTAASLISEFEGTGEATAALTSSSFHKTFVVMDKALSNTECANTITTPTDVGKFVSGCFEAGNMEEYFGWAGILLKPVMALSSLVNFFKSEFTSFVDILKDVPNYMIVMYRLSTADIYATYVNEWHLHGYNMWINANSFSGSSISYLGWCDSLTDMQWCQVHDTFTFVVNADSTLTATVQTVSYTKTINGKQVSYPETPYGITDWKGDTFTLTHDGTHFLTKTQGPDTTTLCDPVVLAQYNPRCGA